ncbi:LOW QUALITY PROTEIN: probable 2-oxoglutarate-dependent dioxygenase AOP1 [Herrania umbratica]|uniref:LOW QUALITY PROTEIN: probable 2-oxoglutarate-dependent dioxygenase AOP1 n=1 Tax=Herrania umbratica TaxID=108875 RepID=A0A6J0ZME7_9ROSI|nr:LOW QUALITY PROTEIN: probable 2-oxoglutarate-dependent dioxygenase AOP1 [Herrania umbratica]
MGSESQFQIPVNLRRGNGKWQGLCRRVREACENYGCFEVVYYLREETFSLIRQLFNLPLETKRKNINPKPYHGYYEPGSEFLPFYESFGLEDASDCNSVKSFAQLMWTLLVVEIITLLICFDPSCFSRKTAPILCFLATSQTINTLMKQLEELSHVIGSMIVDSYGLGGKPESFMTHYELLRVMKYVAPPSGGYTTVGLLHTDKFSSALLCEDGISGLEIETKDGQWVKLFPSPGSFVFIVGDLLTAWSNGRMHAVKHRVMMSGDKDRYSLGAFAVPVEGTIIKAPRETVDEEHPQVFKDFDLMDFLNYADSEESMAIDSAKKLFIFAAQPKRVV